MNQKLLKFFASGAFISYLPTAILKNRKNTGAGLLGSIEAFLIYLILGPISFWAYFFLLIGIILFVVSYDIIKVCLVWGVWSILRESKEMAEAITKLSARKTEIINVVESVIIIALSFTMILEPNESHAYLHIILLGIELVIVVLFYFAEIGGKIIMKRKSQTTENNDKDTNISI